MILGIIAFFIGVMIGVAAMCILYVARDRADKKPVQIPTPHGNLIDREDLLERLALFRDDIRDDYNFVVMIVNGAGVIVEAEGED